MKRYWFILLSLVAGLIVSCKGAPATQSSGTGGLPADAAAVAAERGLTADDVYAAVKTYMPTGQTDPYIMIASGGQSGQVLVIGVPSMRILKVIGVFTPEPWQGYGYGGSSMEVLDGGDVDGKDVLWGDTHHPAISETAGEYDGDFVFINDKANARLAVISLKDFETKQIIKNPNAINDHGGTFVTPNTEYIIEGPQYAAPIGWEYSPMENYADEYRGLVTLWAFDRDAGRVDVEKSFQIELPPVLARPV